MASQQSFSNESLPFECTLRPYVHAINGPLDSAEVELTEAVLSGSTPAMIGGRLEADAEAV